MIKSTFIFCSLKTWGSGILSLATQNYWTATWSSLLITGGLTAAELFTTSEIFGTTYLVLLMVALTVLMNTWSGIEKNKRKSRKFLAIAQKYDQGTKEYRLNIRRWRNHKFDYRKLYFVFFKALSFLTYLTMVKALTSDGTDMSGGPWEIKALFLTTEILIRVPIALFWYYEFKSIGDNSEYIFGSKAMIFTIVGWIFEPRISKFVGAKTPADGVHNQYNEEI